MLFGIIAYIGTVSLIIGYIISLKIGQKITRTTDNNLSDNLN
jgi:hypothetical protein